MNSRLLGAMLIVGSLAVMLAGLLGGMPDTLSTADHIAYVLWGVGGIAGVVGLIQLNALGTNATIRATGSLPIIGFVAFILADGLSLLTSGLEKTVYDALISFGWIAILGGMLVVGILTLAAKSWHGWRRFTPLLTVMMMPMAFVIGDAIGNLAVGGTIAYSCWVLLGLVIATTEPAQTVPQIATA